MPRHPRSRIARLARSSATASLPLLLASCALMPEGSDALRQQIETAGAPYEPAVEERRLPDLPDPPTWQHILSRALLASGELEAAYFDWKAAYERIGIAAAYPNTDISLGYSYAFSSERMNTFDRMTFTAGFDAAKNLSWPTKVAQAGKVALEQAIASGERMRFIKFEVQRRTLFLWADYTLQSRRIDALNEDLELQQVMIRSASAQIAKGGRQNDALTMQVMLSQTRNELRDLEAEHAATRAMLNAQLARDPNAPLAPEAPGAAIRKAPDDDSAMLAAAADVFPEVGVFAAEVKGRAEALELARMRWIPDVGPFLAFTGSVSQAIGATIVLPTTVAEIRGRIRESEAQLRSTQAMLRQKQADRLGEFVGLLIMLRSSERRAAAFHDEIIPAVERLVSLQTSAYTAGAATITEVIEARRTLLEARVALAMAHAAMEKAIVDIECCLGVDVETIGTPPQTPPEPAGDPEPAAGAPAGLAARRGAMMNPNDYASSVSNEGSNHDRPNH